MLDIKKNGGQIEDPSTDRILFKEHPNFEGLKKHFIAFFESMGCLEVGSMTDQQISIIKCVSAGSVHAMRMKKSAWECLNQDVGSRGGALEQAKRENEALKAEREKTRQKMIQMGLNPADFGL